ncbi:MAG: lasso peptide biosynthesis B2 protein [Rhizobacter sp.]|nr:lasso peptide biosynthesis B2 protein [Rhizobacter sp.]
MIHPHGPQAQYAVDTPRQLHLAPHVRACRVEGQIILLDLLRSRYLALSGEALNLVDGTATLALKRPILGDSAGPQLEALVQRLGAQGLLIDHPAAHRRGPDLEEPRRSFDVEDAGLRPALSIACVGRLVRCAALAALSIRMRSLYAITTSAERRRDKDNALQRTTSDPDAIARVAAAYDRLRPLVLTARDKCLQDSLALVHFMAAEGLHPRWVIGVKTRPFGAHAWVQHGDLVLNDQHEHVRRFTPILVV